MTRRVPQGNETNQLYEMRLSLPGWTAGDSSHLLREMSQQTDEGDDCIAIIEPV